jgi:transcriptional regulator with XRE-family HTH domain
MVYESVKEFVDERGSRADIAELLKVEAGTVSNWLNGDTPAKMYLNGLIQYIASKADSGDKIKIPSFWAIRQEYGTLSFENCYLANGTKVKGDEPTSIEVYENQAFAIKPMPLISNKI